MSVEASVSKRGRPTLPADERALATAARGGRVVHTGFLEPDEADALAAALRRAGVAVTVTGGAPGARRRVVVAYPDHLPNADVALGAVYVDGPIEPGALRAAARSAGLDADQLGDVVSHQDGISIITFAPPPAALLALEHVGGQPVAPLSVPLERVAGGARRRQEVVVPSLRVDVLGGKAFRVSRSYFAKGVAAGRVSVNGKPADKGAQADVGDEVFADGLGRFRVLGVEGTTRRGNLRVTLEAERA